MKISQLSSFQVGSQVSAPPRPAQSPDVVVTTPPAETSAFRETVAASAEDWGHMGKKLGTLGAVTLASTYLPMAVANYTYNLPPPYSCPCASVVPSPLWL